MVLNAVDNVTVVKTKSKETCLIYLTLNMIRYVINFAQTI